MRREVASAGRHDDVGTGITEAAAKTIVGTRMKRGLAISQHGGQTVMTFRAAVLSGRFEALQELLHRDYMQRVQDAA